MILKNKGDAMVYLIFYLYFIKIRVENSLMLLYLLVGNGVGAAAPQEPRNYVCTELSHVI